MVAWVHDSGLAPVFASLATFHATDITVAGVACYSLFSFSSSFLCPEHLLLDAVTHSWLVSVGDHLFCRAVFLSHGSGKA